MDNTNQVPIDVCEQPCLRSRCKVCGNPQASARMSNDETRKQTEAWDAVPGDQYGIAPAGSILADEKKNTIGNVATRIWDKLEEEHQLPGYNPGFARGMSHARRKIAELREKLNTALSDCDVLEHARDKLKLRNEELEALISTRINVPTTPIQVELAERIAELEAELARARTDISDCKKANVFWKEECDRLTDEHGEAMATIDRIAELEAELAEWEALAEDSD